MKPYKGESGPHKTEHTLEAGRERLQSTVANLRSAGSQLQLYV